MSDQMNKFMGNGETIIDEHGVETIAVGGFRSNASELGTGSGGYKGAGTARGPGTSGYKPSPGGRE